jgi:ubiquinone/menaquinone biosynthesis C-methylase UbiE
VQTQAGSELQFSNKYDEQYAKQYFNKHQDGFWRRLSDWRDHQIAREALRLAGNPRVVLDAPCGTGRFWDVLAEDPNRVIHASDYNQTMIDTGLAHRSKEITSRIQTFQASAFELPVPDNFVDCIFSIRFVHHLGEAEDRLKLLKEFHRVSRDTVILSMWVDGNIKARTRKSLEQKRQGRAYQNRFVIPVATIEEEFANSGFAVEARLDFLKYYHMWRTYVLRKKQD